MVRIAKLLLVLLCFASIAVAQPTVRAVGTVASNAAAVSPGLPASTAAGDLLLMFCETAAQTITASGWTEYAARGSGTAGGLQATRLTILYKVAVGGDATTTSDSGDHQICRIVGITTGTYDTSLYFEALAESTQTGATTSVSIDGTTTMSNNSLVFASAAQEILDGASTTQFTAPTNADLTSLTERVDNCAAAGNGGCMVVVTGVDGTFGSVGATTSTATTDPDRRVHITFAVRPLPGAAKTFLNLGVGN